MLFADLLSLHLVTFLMFFILVDILSSLCFEVAFVFYTYISLILFSVFISC